MFAEIPTGKSHKRAQRFEKHFGEESAPSKGSQINSRSLLSSEGCICSTAVYTKRTKKKRQNAFIISSPGTTAATQTTSVICLLTARALGITKKIDRI